MIETRKLTESRAWPVKYAHEILEYMNKYKSNKEYILMETGYGPSGLPHIGTFLEVVRTSVIASVLRQIQSKPVVVLSVIDDMDGMRRVPAGLPNQEMLNQYLNYPLCDIPDPFGKCDSFAEYNVAEFAKLLTEFGLNLYDLRISRDNPYCEDKLLQASDGGKNIVLMRASDLYKSGAFNSALNTILQKHQEVLDIMLPTLGSERAATYSPFMPISTTGKVLQNEVCGYNVDRSTVTVREDDNEYEISVLDGCAKLQWKIDFGMRWSVLDVDCELCGKDIIIGTVPIASQIAGMLSDVSPLTKMHEMLLAEDGAKMSKSKGTAIDVNLLLRYLGPNVIRYIMMANPESAQNISLKKSQMYIDLYQKDLREYREMGDVENKIFYGDVCIEGSAPQYAKIDVADLMGMVECVQMEKTENIVDRFDVNDRASAEILDRLNKLYHEQLDKVEFADVDDWMVPYLHKMMDLVDGDAEEIQAGLYDLGKDAVNNGHCKNLKNWFIGLYKVIFGKDTGPRLGGFFAMHNNARQILEDRINAKRNME